MNRELLLKMLKIPSPSGKEKNIINFICSFLDKEQIKYTLDKAGNIYSLDFPNKPLLSAHIDTVQEAEDIIMSDFIYDYGSFIKGAGVIGGDDKCGVFIILEILKERKDINFIFSVQEEVGGLGIFDVIENEKEKIKKCSYGLVIDRKGNSDIISVNNGYGTKKFEEFLLKKSNGNFYSSTGTFSDANYICDLISCANISSGYYNAHTKKEFIMIEDVKKTLEFIKKVIEDDTKFEAPISTLSDSFFQNYDDSFYQNYEDSFYKNNFSNFYGKTIGNFTVYDFDVCDICRESTTTYKIKYLEDTMCLKCLKEKINNIEKAFKEILRFENDRK